MPDLKLRKTSYDRCGQEAWEVDAGEPCPLFYLVRDGGNWTAMESLGRGYTAGSIDVPHCVEVRARTLNEAKRRVFYELAARLEAKSIEINDRAGQLRAAVDKERR